MLINFVKLTEVPELQTVSEDTTMLIVSDGEIMQTAVSNINDMQGTKGDEPK